MLQWVLALLWLLSTSAGAAQSLTDIEQTVKSHVKREFSSLGTISAIEITSLDPRLKLAACEKRLEAFTANGQRRLGNTTIGVRCSGARPWTLYVPVKIVSQVTVLTAAQPLSRGALLTAADLVPVVRDAATLPHGYFTQPKELIGMQLRRTLRVGEVILPNAVGQPPLVERGQAVLLTAETGGIKVTMKGEALQDGGAGERIQVRNLSSRKIIEGEVLGRNHVRVPL